MSRLARPKLPKNSNLNRRAESRERDSLILVFKKYLERSALAPTTIRNYIADVGGFARWRKDLRLEKPPQLEHLQGYRDYLIGEGKQSHATVNRRLQALRLFGRCLQAEGILRANPAVGLQLLPNGQETETLPRVLDQDEIERLVIAVRASARPSLMRRDYAIIQLLLQAGLRVNEAAALNVQDLISTREGMRLIVRGAGRDHYRQVPLNETLAGALRDYLTVRPALSQVERLFVSQRGQPLSTRSIQRLVESYAQAAQLEDVCANSLRHTCAKKMLDETHAPQLVALWLGHKRVESLNRYK